MAINLLRFSGILGVLLCGCSSGRGGGGGGDDDDGAGAGDTSFIAPYSACSGAAVDELWGPVFDMRAGMLADGVAPILTCIRSADDCAAVLGCVGYDASGSCDPDTFSDACEGGSVGVRCDGLANGMNVIRRTDCAEDPSGNSECVLDGEYAMCSSGSCDGVGGSSCEGDVLVDCFSEIELRFDCASRDSTCIATEDGVQCGLAGESCDTSSCEGDVLLQCDDFSGVLLGRLDCADVIGGATCREDADGPRCGLPSAEEECEDGDSRCEGSVARSCMGGKWFDIDCSTFDDAACEPADEGVRCVTSDWP